MVTISSTDSVRKRHCLRFLYSVEFTNHTHTLTHTRITELEDTEINDETKENYNKKLLRMARTALTAPDAKYV